MINSYKDDPRYKELASIVDAGGSTEGLEEYLRAQGVIQDPYNYNTPTKNVNNSENEEYNPYSEGMHFDIPDEYVQDYTKEYERLSQPENYDPLLMYILQKNAESGFPNGSPVNAGDLYYESYDPRNHPELEGDFTDFLNVYYPDFQERLKQARETDPNGETFKHLNDIDNMRYYNKHEFDYDDLYSKVPEDEVYGDMLIDAGYFPSQDKNTFGYYSDDPMDFYNAEAESDLLSDFYNEEYGYPENLDQLYDVYYELNEPSVINRAKSDPKLQQRINKLNKFFEDNQL